MRAAREAWGDEDWKRRPKEVDNGMECWSLRVVLSSRRSDSQLVSSVILGGGGLQC